MARWK